MMNYYMDKLITISRTGIGTENHEQVVTKDIVYSEIVCDFYPVSAGSFFADNTSEQSRSGSYEVVLPYGISVKHGRECELIDPLQGKLGLYQISEVVPMQNGVESYVLLCVDNINAH